MGLKELLDKRYERSRARLSATVTSCPTDATGHGLGYVLATVGGQAGVRVLTDGPSTTYYPGANLLVEQLGDSRAAAQYAVVNWGGGPLPDTGIIEFASETEIGNITYEEGDLVWGNPLSAHFWLDYSNGIIYLMVGDNERGKIDPNTSSYVAGNPNDLHAVYGPGSIEFLSGDELLSKWDAVGRTIYGVETLGRPHGPGIQQKEFIDEAGETRYKWQVLGLNGVPGVSFVTGSKTDPDDYGFFVGPTGSNNYLRFEDGELALAGELNIRGNSTITGTLTIEPGGSIVNEDITLDGMLMQIFAQTGGTSFEPTPQRGIKWVLEDGSGIGLLTTFQYDFVPTTKFNVQKMRVVTDELGTNARQYFQAASRGGSYIYHQVFDEPASSDGSMDSSDPAANTELYVSGAGKTAGWSANLSSAYGGSSFLMEYNAGYVSASLKAKCGEGESAYITMQANEADMKVCALSITPTGIGFAGAPVSAGSQRIIDVADPTTDTDALNRQTGDTRYCLVSTGYLTAAGTVVGGTSQAQAFSKGIEADTVEEYTDAAGVTIDGLKIRDGAIVKLSPRVFMVAPTGGDYNTLSAALAAITDASDSNEYLVVVSGEIAETAAITAKSYVNVLFLPGASVTVTSASALNAVNFNSVTDTTWAAVSSEKPHIIRAGALSTIGSHGVYMSSCGATVRLTNINVANVTTAYGSCYGIYNASSSPTMTNCTVTGGAGGTNCHGIYNNTSSPTMTNCTVTGGASGGSCHGIYNNTSSPTMTNCTVTGGAGGTNCHGIYNNTSSSPTMTNCTGKGGAGGGSCHGIINSTGSSPTMTNCTGTGGAGGASCYGIYNTTSSPTMTNCTGKGGAGGGSCHGIINSTGSSPTMTNCTGTGGAGGAICYGIYNTTSSPTMTNCIGTGGAGGGSCHGIANSTGSSPTMTNCVGTGGAGGTSCYGIYNTTSSSPTMTNCVGTPQRFSASASVTATSRQEDTFQPTATHPWRLLGVTVNVTAAAAAGVTLTLRDATGGGGNALSAAQAVDSTGYKYIPITGHRIISAGAYVYARLSAIDTKLAYTIYYVYETAYGTCYGLYQDTNAAVTIQDCVFVSNAASPAIYITNNGDDSSVFIGGTARSGYNDATRQKALVCQSAWNPGQVYNMVLDGGSTNLTAASGTANGSCIVI